MWSSQDGYKNLLSKIDEQVLSIEICESSCNIFVTLNSV
jgi:hypothetical protein